MVCQDLFLRTVCSISIVVGPDLPTMEWPKDAKITQANELVLEDDVSDLEPSALDLAHLLVT